MPLRRVVLKGSWASEPAVLPAVVVHNLKEEPVADDDEVRADTRMPSRAKSVADLQSSGARSAMRLEREKQCPSRCF